MRGVLWFACLFLVFHLAEAQSSVIRSFTETGGSVTTGNNGDINSFSNGDVLVVTERWTNFSQKGLQLFRLAEEGLSIRSSRAYYNDFTITTIRTAMRNDSIFILAQHNNGGIDKLLFLVFDADLGLVRSKLIEAADVGRYLLGYSFYASVDGSFRIYHNTSLGTDARRGVISIDALGTVIWSSTIGTFAPLWGGSALLPDGTLIGLSNGDYFGVDKTGKVVWSKKLGPEFNYSLNGTINNKGEAMFCQGSSDSGAHFAVRINKGGNYSGLTASSYTQAPVFFEALPGGISIMGSSSFAGQSVNLKLSLYAQDGQFVKNVLTDNVYGYASGTTKRDACRYTSHSDSKGNLLVLGVANRKGFFVFRYNPSLGFDCGFESSGSQPSPVPELSGASYSSVALNLNVADYTFLEEAPGNYKPVCLACGSALTEYLWDTTVCLDTGVYQLNAGNSGAAYLWEDGSSSATRTITQGGLYWVRISNDCDTLIDSIRISMRIRPKVQASFSPEEPLPGEEIQLLAEPDTFSRISWYLADTLFSELPKTKWTAKRNGTYIFVLNASTYPDCPAYDTLPISVVLLDYYFPNAFTPDHDGLNDTWGAAGYGVQGFRMKIFNRWGQVIFDAENNNWDGMTDGVQVPDGLYHYMIWLTDDHGAARFFKGQVYVLR